MIEKIVRFVNQVRHGNPYGAPHSIDVIRAGGQLPRIPKYLASLERRTLHRISKNPGDGFDKLQLIYEYLDEYNLFVQTFSVCKRGCHHCCKIDVAVTKLEALYIERKTGRAAHRARKRSRNRRTPCPMLSADGACGIYDFRPFNCRTFHTLDDAALCATPGVPHAVYGSSGGNPPYQSDCYRVMANALHVLNRSGEVKDIRDYF